VRRVRAAATEEWQDERGGPVSGESAGGNWKASREVILQESMSSFTDQAATNHFGGTALG